MWYPFINDGVKYNEEDEDYVVNHYIKYGWKQELKPFFNPQDFSMPKREVEANREARDVENEIVLGTRNVLAAKHKEFVPKTCVRNIYIDGIILID